MFGFNLFAHRIRSSLKTTARNVNTNSNSNKPTNLIQPRRFSKQAWVLLEFKFRDTSDTY